MRKVFIALLVLLLTNTAAAKDVSEEVDRGVASVKERKLDFSAEARVFTDDATPEYLLKYKNFSVDWVRRDDRENFLKLKLDREIFSLMGSGIEWHVALNGYSCHGNFAALPSAGLNLYVRVRPRLDIYVQFSGMTLGHRGHFSDFESGIRYFPRKNFSISAGWRQIDFKLRRGGELSNFVQSGLFVGARYDW